MANSILYGPHRGAQVHQFGPTCVLYSYSIVTLFLVQTFKVEPASSFIMMVHRAQSVAGVHNLCESVNFLSIIKRLSKIK